jgi:hypothetical protein
VSNSDVEIIAAITTNGQIVIVDNSSITVDGNLKWLTNPDVDETWDGISDEVVIWTSTSDVEESWSSVGDQSKEWSNVADEPLVWH